jgi:predicted AAA+ superfamily ATPase
MSWSYLMTLAFGILLERTLRCSLKDTGVDVTTIQSWISLLEQNGVVRVVQPYFNNLNQRLIKMPKFYFEDVALAVRLQGWSQFGPLSLSPYFGSLIENLAFSEIERFFTNRAMNPAIYFVRSKEKVEVDFLIKLPNDKYIAAEVKTTPVDLTQQQLKLIDSLGLNIVEKWVLSPIKVPGFTHGKCVSFEEIHDNLEKVRQDLG